MCKVLCIEEEGGRERERARKCVYMYCTVRCERLVICYYQLLLLLLRLLPMITILPTHLRVQPVTPTSYIQSQPLDCCISLTLLTHSITPLGLGGVEVRVEFELWWINVMMMMMN